MKRLRLKPLLAGLLLVSFSVNASATGFTTVTDWNETAVRKVLHTFAYGGFATDTQIKQWAQMPPQQAINEILSFEAENPKLSPAQDKSAMFGHSLQSLQDFWSSADPDNPVREDRRLVYGLLYTNEYDETFLADPFLKLTWVQAATTRGINPFLHRVGFYLTNYHMALSIHKTEPGLMRDFYDHTIQALQQGKDFIDILAQGASSAAVAYAYGHQHNYFVNINGVGLFSGNDDFAREFHQLFFRIQGTTEDQDYHENTTIEHTARALTGMFLDYTNPWGSSFDFEWAASPIDFSDHEFTDGAGKIHQVFNSSLHHKDDLEILHTPISGQTAGEKIYNLARVAGYHPESMNNIPVTIIDFFADDNLNEEKIMAIRSAWRQQEPKSLLGFLRSYAISTTFHREDTVKYRSAFDRNLLVHNFNTLDNIESFARNELPVQQMQKEGADVFVPAHDVFGGQTGLQAANNPNIFKEAYQRNVQQSGYLARTSHKDKPALPVVWEKDWSKLLPKSSNGQYPISHIADWLWQRFIGDGGKHFGIMEKAHLYALLVDGKDLGLLLNPDNPEYAYSLDELSQEPINGYIKAIGTVNLPLDSDIETIRREVNRRIGLAVNFISITPFMFAMEGK